MLSIPGLFAPRGLMAATGLASIGLVVFGANFLSMIGLVNSGALI